MAFTWLVERQPALPRVERHGSDGVQGCWRHPLFRWTFRGLSDEVTRRGWGLISFTPAVNAEDADEIRWFEAEKDPPLADAEAQFTGTVLEGFTLPWLSRLIPPAGRETTRRITARAGAGLPPGGHRRPVPYGPDPAWPQSRHRRSPAHPVPQEKKWPPVPRCPEGHPRAIEGDRGRRTCRNYSFTGDQPISARTSSDQLVAPAVFAAGVWRGRMVS